MYMHDICVKTCCLSNLCLLLHSQWSAVITGVNTSPFPRWLSPSKVNPSISEPDVRNFDIIVSFRIIIISFVCIILIANQHWSVYWYVVVYLITLTTYHRSPMVVTPFMCTVSRNSGTPYRCWHCRWWRRRPEVDPVVWRMHTTPRRLG